ncbi:MAG: small ribosomal subunit Rsm22 family protein [Bdellovibrionales bacterium]
MAMPVHSLTPEFEQQILKALTSLAVDLKEPRALAAQVKQLSDFYVSRAGEPTPWDQPFAVPAYLAYFQTLNFVRLRAAFQEVKRFLPMDSFAQIWDYGSGSGTTQWVLESEPSIAPRALFAIESSKRAAELHREFGEGAGGKWVPQFSKGAQPGAKAFAVFSYSFLEMQNQLPDLQAFDHLLIVEPSTREGGRDLMAWRAKLMEGGFTPLAPCTHSEPCPLLTQSSKDWCHMRIHFSAPAWFERLEEFLPMKNRTLTYSYLLMSRTVGDVKWRGSARAIGDTLEENGKTRQMICRGPNREFLSWLHRFGEPPEIPHGALVSGVDDAEEKSGELRAKPDSLAWES